MSERINRYLASCGLGSRRQADQWIEAGRVKVNGELATPGLQIEETDLVMLDDKLVSVQEDHTYILYNKPPSLLCSRKDAKKRPLIYDNMDVPKNVQSIGRLDMDSEGLLLLSSDGILTQALIHPKHRIIRTYKVKITGQLSLESMQALREGGIDMGENDKGEKEKSVPWDLIVEAQKAGHCWVKIHIKRGRWREIRRTMAALGHQVRRLIRIKFGPIKLDETMPRGAWRDLKASEVRQLQKAVGIATGKKVSQEEEVEVIHRPSTSSRERKPKEQTRKPKTQTRKPKCA
ncbi:MAG: pseudouridine synthase [Mariprofundaceae bacterium]|nr:pseudouridine synthase [Mariprofundaceae bacterium]